MTDEQPKVPFSAILRSTTAEKFAEVFGSSSRKARETYFHRHGVRAAAPTHRLPKPGAKNEARTAALYERLQHEEDDEMAEEILRTFLLSKRPMLKAALDHLGIENQDGLTESNDVDKFGKLGKSDLKAIIKKLEATSNREDVLLYLKYMGCKDVDEVVR